MCKLCTSTCVFSSSSETNAKLIFQTKITDFEKLYNIKISYNINKMCKLMVLEIYKHQHFKMKKKKHFVTNIIQNGIVYLSIF